MKVKKVTDFLSVSEQIKPEDVPALAAQGFKSIMCNRPDGESGDQPNFKEIEEACQAHDLECFYLPVTSGAVNDDETQIFKQKLREMPSPMLAYCRTGTRSITLWALAQAKTRTLSDILDRAKAAGYDLSGTARRIINGGKISTQQVDITHDVVIVGAGAAGLAVAASLKKRKKDLDVAVIDPAEIHYYQPGWTLVGAGVFKAEQTVRTIASLMPKGVHWLKAAVAAFEPEDNTLVLEGCRIVKYKYLIICPGIKLDWAQIEGLEETLGKNGVTSNYRYDLASYTWELVKNLKSGRAVFCQPPMPIKCAGAPQKAMYMSGDYWLRSKVLKGIKIDFFNAGAVLFGVKEYLPALMKYVERYKAQLHFGHRLVKIDGATKTAWFEKTQEGKAPETVEVPFDMIHIVPPQTAPDFVRVSPLVDENGWVDVDQSTLQHKKYNNIYSLGDVTNAPNAKTAAAARKQAPVVALNVLNDMNEKIDRGLYDGYGSCPLTVERGKVILAEFGYGGKIQSSFPRFIIDGTKPSRLSWFFKEKMLPPIYWLAMLKGREWMAKPEVHDAKEQRGAQRNSGAKEPPATGGGCG